MAQSDTLTARLTELVRDRPAAAHDLVQAERYLRDWIGSLAAGGATPAGAILRDYARDRTDLEGRVFLAAALSHITESDDLHRGSITHPGCVVVPTALLLGRRNGADGRRILHAVLVGYEVMLRVGEALGPGHYEVFHNTATAGVFGSAAAAAHLLELDESGWISALGNAGTQAAGLWQFNQDATMSKHLHAGHAAQAGLRAALLAGHGFTGPAAILEGEKGFFRGFCPDPAPGRVLAPATNWKLAETSFKPYPSCRHTHPAIDAALDIRRRIRSPADAVERITSVRIWTYPAALRLTDNPAPSSSYAAKFSIQFCVATALVHGAPGLAAFEGNRLSDPR
ncbi:MAG: MmgE/PrpD family protein, partial [Gemmatimonadota bacterium]